MFEHIWCIDNMGSELGTDFLKKITDVVPSERQYEHSKLKYYNFIHFGMNTMTGLEWGDGTVSPSVFNPEKLDTDQWCRVLKETGSKGIIITAKHHDGFCLWNTKTTDYNVMNSPFGKDIVKLLSESCKKYGLKLGIYISPWDRHEKTYGSDAYNDFYKAQLRELATNYGEIFTFWFDGACGEGPNGKKQEYDFEGYFSLLRDLQPKACLAICGPDVRWIGNEGGQVRKSEWSVVPSSVTETEKVAEKSQQENDNGKKILEIKAEDEDLGSREFLENFNSFRWSPAECDVSVNLGWFWHNDEYYRDSIQRTGADIAKIYMNTVGGNAYLLLNVPPDDTGLISDREIKILKDFKLIIDEKFSAPITAESAEIRDISGRSRPANELLNGDIAEFSDTEHAVVLQLGKKQKISLVSVEEDILKSQRVENFEIYAREASDYKKVYDGTVIGNGKFCEFSAETDELIINISRARNNPILKDIKIYG